MEDNKLIRDDNFEQELAYMIEVMHLASKAGSDIIELLKELDS